MIWPSYLKDKIMINAPSSTQFDSRIRIPFFRSMRGKLIFWFLAVSLIPLVIVGQVAITQLYAAKAAANEVSNNYFPSIINLYDAEIALLHIIEAQKNHIIAPDDASMRAMETKIKTQRKTLVKALAGFDITLDEGTETEAFEKFQNILNDFLQVNNQVILLSQKNDDDKAQALSVGKANDLFDNALGLMKTMRETNVFGSEQAKIAADKAARTGVILTLIASLVVTVIVVIVAVLVANSIAKPVLIVTEAARKLATGNVKSTGIDTIEIGKVVTRRDEMGEIGRTFDALASYFQAVIEDIVQVSQGLAAGNLSVIPQSEYRGDFIQIKNALEMGLSNLRQVIEDIVHVSQGLAEGTQSVMPHAEYQGDFVQIKQALETAAAKLAEATTKNAEQNWLKTGQTQLNDQTRGDQDMVKLAKNIISFLTTYLGVQVGLFYRLKESEQPEQPSSLQVIASYAYTASDNIPNKFLVGEGLVGQAALERKMLSRTHTPDEYTPIIQSGLAKAVPCHVLILPFLYEDAVKGVIELGSSEAITDIQWEFLEQAMPNIGIAINTAESRTKMQELLEQSQQQTEELQSQSEELQSQQEEMQQINEELQTQREELQHKQEELQQRNEELQSQAEELQSQSEELQTQQEELKQTNEALEERSKELEQQKDDAQQKNIALEKTQTDMKRAQVALETKAQQLELASQYKSEFLANMSHELRTPLNSLLILAQLLAENKAGNLTDKQVKYAQTINSSGSDLLKLINEILDLSKVEAGKMEVSVEDVSLTELMETVEQKFRPLALDKGLAFHIKVANDLPAMLHTDAQRFQQVLNNLLSNAFKFTTDGEIKLTLRYARSEEMSQLSFEAAQTIAISVTDTGIGIPTDKQQLIFEAFQQVDGTTSRRFGGTGLGLSISIQLAKLLGGEIQLHSEDGKGSTFTLYLPEKLSSAVQKFRSSAVQETKVLEVSKTDKPFTALTSGETAGEIVTQVAPAPEKPTEEIVDDRALLTTDSKSLLIIEDDRKFSGLLMELAQEKDFKCLIAEDGKTGLNLAQQYKPHAVILDVGLPQLDGWTVLERLKDNPDTRHIPVHFISAADHHSLEAKKRGAIGYLHKPVNLEQLGETFQQIEQFLSKTMKNLLVIVDSEPHQQQILELVGGETVQTTLAATTAVALQHLKKAAFDCIILDMEIEQSSGLKLLEQMQQQEGFCQIPLIVYAGRELTASEEASLLECADHLTVKTVSSPERLLDEATLFLHQLEANLSKDKQNLLRMVHDKEAILTNKKVMIADDDIRNTFALTTFLEDKHMEVVVGNNGKEALELLEEHSDVAIVLMDIMMPEMDGYEAMRQIRAQPRFRKLPIIALTAKAMKGDKGKCIEAGANDYLSKPVDTEKLISLMRVWLYR